MDQEPLNELRELRKNIRKRVLRIISIVTGISLGTFLLILGGTLIAISIFVRTETFQNGLRDRILQAAQSRFGVSVQYETAKVSVFKLEPTIELLGVEARHKNSTELAKIKRVSVGISVFFSIPLLFFKELYLSSIEIEGFRYHLKNINDIRIWLDTARPKSVIIPSAFQTSIGDIRLQNVELEVDLTKGVGAIQDVHGILNIEDVQLSLSARETEFEGLIHLTDLKSGTWGPFSGDVKLQNGSHSNRRTRFGSVRFESATEYLEISGEIRKWADPFLDLYGTVSADINHLFPRVKKSKGNLAASFRVAGPWKSLVGSGAISATDVTLQGKDWTNAQAKFELKYPEIVVSNLDLQSGSEKVRGSGQIFLVPDRSSTLKLEVAHAPLGGYLSLVGEHLGKWQGDVNGTVELEGKMADQFQGQFRWNLKMDNYRIRTFQTEREILFMPEVVTKGSGTLTLSSGEFSAELETGGSKWKGGAKWDEKNFDLRWDTTFHGKDLGELYRHPINFDGVMKGSYSGPKSSLVMKVDNQFSYFQMAGYKLTNFRGLLMLKNRHLTAEPFLSDQMSLNGGLYFTKPGQEDEFSNLKVTTRAAPLSFLGNLFHIQDLPVSGLVTSEGFFKGRLDQPLGSGRVELNDWALQGDRTKGRQARAHWAMAENETYLDAIEVRVSPESKPIRAELTMDSNGIADLWAEGQGVRLSDWLYLMRRDFNFQGLTDFRLDYQRAVPSMKADMNIYKSSLAGTAQLDSAIHLNWVKDSLDFNGSLFGTRIRVTGSASQNARQREAKLKASLNFFDVFTLSEVPSLRRLQLPVDGEANFTWKQERSRSKEKNLLIALFTEDFSREGEIKIRRATIQRGDLALQTLDPFEVKLVRSSSGNERWVSDTIRVHSERNLLKVGGYYGNPSDFKLTFEGDSDLRSVVTMVPSIARSEGNFSIHGELVPSGFSGRLEVENGVVAFQNSPVVIRDVEAVLTAKQSQFSLEKLKGSLKEGSVSGAGTLRLENFEVSSALLNLRLENTLIQPETGLSFRTSGPITLRVESPNNGEIGGRLDITDGIFRRRVDAKADLLKMLEPEKREFQPLEQQEPAWKLWKLNVQMVTSSPFDIRNNLAEGAATMNLTLGGTLREPQLRGAINIVRGQFRYNNRQFVVRSGSIQFTDQKSNIPSYDIRAETEVDIYRVDINLVGGPGSQRIRYSSDPPLTEKEILALITYGMTPRTSLDEEQRTSTDPRLSAAYTGISFVTGQLQDKLEGRLSTDLGIQRLSLLPAFYEQTGQTELQLTVGADLIRNRLLLNYSNFLTASGGHRVELDFALNRVIHLVGSWRDVETESNGDFGGDIRFRFEFE